MLSFLKLAAVALGLVATVNAHAHLSGVRTASGQTASNRNKIRNGIVRNAGSGIPGSEATYGCDWCVLEGSNKNAQRYSAQWWSQNPGAWTTSSNTWPAVPCMSRDTYGARGTLNVRPGENITTSTWVNADHGGFYRFELSYNTNPTNSDFFNRPISDYYAISVSNETPGFSYPGRRVGPSDADLQTYIKRMSCTGVQCGGGNIRDQNYSETWTFPANAQKGPAVMRWMWSSLETPEIYAHCADLNIV
jgi:hypothetical protein